MTREEAIKILKEDGCGYCTWQSINPYECENKECEVKEALNMAIQALSQKPICPSAGVDCEDCPAYEPSEDWYDVPSNEMTLEQARQAVKDLRKKLTEYLEQEPKSPCDLCRFDYMDGVCGDCPVMAKGEWE